MGYAVEVFYVAGLVTIFQMAGMEEEALAALAAG